MKYLHYTLLGLFTLGLFQNVNAQRLSGKPVYVKGELIVHFRDGFIDHERLQASLIKNARFNTGTTFKNPGMRFKLDSLHILGARKLVRNATIQQRKSISRTGETVDIPDFHNLLCLYVPEETNIPELCNALIKLPGVLYAEPNYIMYQNALDPDDPEYFEQRALEQSNDRDIDAERAWDFSTGSNTVRVGVLDSGIDYNHPDLGGSFGTSALKVKGGYDYFNDDSNPDDDGNSSHGTSVAGIIGALSNNGIGVAGIAGGDADINNQGVQLFAFKIGGTNDFTSSNVIEAIYDASTSTGSGGYGCHILNYSGGSYPDTFYPVNGYRKALSYAALNGVVFVAAKGNDDTDDEHYPSDFADNLVLSVGASDGLDERADFSNYGNDMDVVAPGTSSLLFTTKRVESGEYGTFDGTSGAAPVVAGIAALLKSVNINLHQDDVENVIQLSAEDKGDAGYDNFFGHGRVNAGRALEFLHAPYVLQQHTATGGTSRNVSYVEHEKFSFLNDAGNSGLAEGVYIGQIYEVTKTVTIPRSACNEQYVWTRTTGATVGWSAGNPNNNLGFSYVVSQNGDQVTLRTFVFFIENSTTPLEINAWFPAAPQNVIFAYTTLTNAPYSTNISGPSSVCTSGSTLALTTVPPNSTITWQATPSNLFAVSSGTGSSATLTAAKSGSGTLTFTINTPCGTPVQVSKTFWVGKPSLAATYSNGGLVRYTWPGDPLYYNSVSNLIEKEVKMVPSGASGSWQRIAANPTNTDWSASGNTLTFYFFQGGQTATFRYTASNTCGSISQDYSFKSTGSSGGGCSQYSVSPNPSNVSVNIAAPLPNIPAPCPGSTAASTELVEQAGSNLSIQSIRLYDSDGQLRQFKEFATGTKSVELNISDLRKGVYILNVSDGLYTETHRVIIMQ